MHVWQLQEAKARFSELIRQVGKEGPQMITVRGDEEAVVLSATAYQKLTGQQPSFLEFVAHSPLKGLELAIARDRSAARPLRL